MSYKKRTDQSEKAKVTEICKANKGDLVTFPDGSYQCSGVLDATVDFAMGKMTLEETGGPSRLHRKVV